MSYYNEGNNVKETTQNKIVAVATYEAGAKIIAKALNFYFDDTYTRNKCVEMVHQNTSNTLKEIAELAKKQEIGADELIEYLLEISESMAAQAMVVSMRDELKFGKVKTDDE